MINQEILMLFAGRNVLVTGGTGMIGREVAAILCSATAKVRIVSLDRIVVHPKAEHVYGDLTDFSFCKQIATDIDYVFHVAGIKGSIEVTKSKPASFFVPLLMMNTNMLEACRVNKVKKVVYTSSIGAYPSAEIFREADGNEGPPMDMFPGWAKRMAEMQVQAYRIQYGLDNFAVVRPCNVYGPGDNFDPKNAMVIPTLMSRIANKENPVVIWGDGSAVRDFAFSRDVAEGVILALYHGTKDQPFLNLGSGVGVTIRELVETLHRFLDFNYRFDASKPSGFPKRVMDISLARQMLGYNPSTSLHDGLKETWSWFMAHRQEYLQRQNYFA
ncbi:MAG: NAD-dependent epimerase/dehydratase family protein [Verrucomicrobia bacterium]|nr:NAD-dependent epimerase/dehydratase family protein [Verrucomicrobiota bacterium]MBU1735460.1 NAD-dependent epimerase/dehydratase family protein [Verrucomicrobiota bacterium]MBU1856855.1 NAD-dependent epimerase/dehydratase family protein [Verrucomicrobiota bacterium]